MWVTEASFGHLLGVRAEGAAELAAHWTAVLDRFAPLVVADGVRLISSVPGRHAPPRAPGPRRCVYGSARLADCLAQAARARGTRARTISAWRTAAASSG
jgi:hypothetical protein